MSDRLLGSADHLPSRARRWLMAVLPLALLGALVAGFALAPRPAGTHSNRSRSIGLLPPSPTTATDAPARPAPPLQTGRSHVSARASGAQRERERSRTAHRPPVRGPVSERPPAPASGSAEGMMLAVARRFAVAYMPYQVGRLPGLGADRVRARHARPGSRATCSPSRRGRPRFRRRTRRRSRPTGSLAWSRPGRRTRSRSATSQSRTAPTPASCC